MIYSICLLRYLQYFSLYCKFNVTKNFWDHFFPDVHYSNLIVKYMFFERKTERKKRNVTPFVDWVREVLVVYLLEAKKKKYCCIWPPILIDFIKHKKKWLQFFPCLSSRRMYSVMHIDTLQIWENFLHLWSCITLWYYK